MSPEDENKVSENTETNETSSMQTENAPSEIVDEKQSKKKNKVIPIIIVL